MLGILEVESQFWPWVPGEGGQFFSIGRKARSPPQRFGVLWEVTLMKLLPAGLVLAIALLEQSLDIRKFGGEITILAMATWRRRSVLFHRKESPEPHCFSSRCKVTLDMPRSVWPVRWLLGGQSSQSCSVFPWFYGALKCHNGALDS